MKIDAQERKWQRESDASTLASAEEIKASPSRLKGAVKQAKVMAKETAKRATNMRKVATRNSPTKKQIKSSSRSTSNSNTRTPLTTAKKRK